MTQKPGPPERRAGSSLRSSRAPPTPPHPGSEAAGCGGHRRAGTHPLGASTFETGRRALRFTGNGEELKAGWSSGPADQESPSPPRAGRRCRRAGLTAHLPPREGERGFSTPAPPVPPCGPGERNLPRPALGERAGLCSFGVPTVTAEPAARGRWHDVPNSSNRKSLTTSRRTPRPSGPHDRPDPPGSRRRGSGGPPRPLPGTARHPRRPAARGPLTSAHAHPVPDGLTSAHARPATPPPPRAHASTHARLARSGDPGSGARGRASSGWEAGGGRGSRDRQPAPAP